ncbi:secretoglobin family 1D member-like [Herpailurus yagouaroundi]|uniref:secretoglobin family 1D member-like n=1 Tax=Herpailurus yagouaroundi TaxID=1608482 RepID=UPI001AD65E44|nr:secretoglobin family 1D member-like [Puma yagouaroundi]
MRLFLSVLLVTLTLCCYEANALACPAFVQDISGFLLKPTIVFEPSLAKYEAPPENVQAVLDVKSCTDNIPYSGRLSLIKIMVTSFFFVHRGFCSAE